MNITNLGVGALATWIFLHAALSLVTVVWYTSLNTHYDPTKAECREVAAQVGQRALDPQTVDACQLDGWAQLTPFGPLLEAIPEGQNLSFTQLPGLVLPMLKSIIRLIYPSYTILQQVDPVTNFVVIVVSVISAMTITLLLLSVGQRLIGGLVGGRPFS